MSHGNTLNTWFATLCDKWHRIFTYYINPIDINRLDFPFIHLFSIEIYSFTIARNTRFRFRSWIRCASCKIAFLLWSKVFVVQVDPKYYNTCSICSVILCCVGEIRDFFLVLVACLPLNFTTYRLTTVWLTYLRWVNMKKWKLGSRKPCLCSAQNQNRNFYF